MARLIAVLSLALAMAGCSAVAAIGSRPCDFSALRVGAGRGTVERSLGRPESVEQQEGSVRATYRVRVGAPGTSAAENLAIAGGVATSTGLAVARGCREVEPFDRAAGVAAGAVTFVAADLFLAARTLVRAARHPRCEVVVDYDLRGHVRHYVVGER